MEDDEIIQLGDADEELFELPEADEEIFQLSDIEEEPFSFQEETEIVPTIPKESDGPEQNDVGTIQSVLAGVASGIVKIPEGVVSLGAELYDLGADTNTAAKVEKWFDDINPFDEAAEGTTAGKITETLVSLGVPGGIAFSKGSKLASKVLKARRAKKYKQLNDKELNKAEIEAIKLNGKEKAIKYGAGSLGSGIAEGVFVADVEKIGTFGDLIGGPTELDRTDFEDPARDLINRVKFGTEGALFSGLIGGVGATIKKLANRSKALEAKDTAIDKLLDKYLGAPFRARGKKTPEFFEKERQMIGQRARDVNRAQEIARDMNKRIDGLFPYFKRLYDSTTKEQKKGLEKILNDVLLSGRPIISGKGQVSFGKLDEALVKKAKKELNLLGSKSKDTNQIFKNIEDIRGEWGNMFSQVGYMLKGEKAGVFKEFQRNFAEKFQEYLGGTYDIFINKPLVPFMGYRPTRQAMDSAIEMMKQTMNVSTETAEKYVSEIVKTARIPKALTFTDVRNPDPVFKSPIGFLKNSVSKEMIDASESRGGFISLRFVSDKPITIAGKKTSKRKILEDLFGKIENPTQTILGGTERISGITRSNQFYRNIKEVSDNAIKQGGRGMFFKTAEEAENVFGVGNVKQAFFDPNRVFEIGSSNPIKNLYTSEGIAEALEVGQKSLISDPMLSFVYDSFILYPKATSQIAKTILSPVTHARNFFSAGAFAAAQGFIPGVTVSPLEMGKAFKNAYKSLQTALPGTRKESELYRELLELGVVNSNVRLGDLKNLLKDIDFGEGFNNRKGLSLLLKPFKNIKKVSEDLYTAEDDIWKITTWALEQDRLKKAYLKAGIKEGDEILDIAGNVRKFDDKFLKEEAANIVRNNMPNYDYVGSFIQRLRRFPVGNFVSFPAEILRTGTNIVRRALREINYSTTIDGKRVKPLASIGYKRLFGFGTTVAAVPYMTVEAAKAIYNVTEDEMEALRRYVPDWSKNSTLVPVRDEKTGELKYVDFSHGNAYDTLTRPIQTVINAVAQGKEDEDGMMDDFMIGLFQATKELGSPFISESIWTEAATDIIVRGGRTRDGRQVYNPEAEFGKKVEDIIAHLVESQTPGSVNAFKRLDLAIDSVDIIEKGKYDERGRTYEVGGELLGFMGFRPVEVKPLDSIDFKIADFTNRIKDARKLFTSQLLKGGPVSPGDIVDQYLASNQAAYKIKKDFFKDYLAALRLGANQDEVERIIQDRLGRKELNKLKQATFSPLNVSKGVKDAFEENALKIGQPNPYEIVEDYIRDIYTFYRDLPMGLEELPSFPNPFKEIELEPTDTSYLPPDTGTGPGTVVTGIGAPASSGLNTQQKGKQVFGAFDTIFGE